jgi:hypothetical protein
MRALSQHAARGQSHQMTTTQNCTKATNGIPAHQLRARAVSHLLSRSLTCPPPARTQPYHARHRECLGLEYVV